MSDNNTSTPKSYVDQASGAIQSAVGSVFGNASDVVCHFNSTMHHGYQINANSFEERRRGQERQGNSRERGIPRNCEARSHLRFIFWCSHQGRPKQTRRSLEPNCWICKGDSRKLGWLWGMFLPWPYYFSEAIHILTILLATQARWCRTKCRRKGSRSSRATQWLRIWCCQPCFWCRWWCCCRYYRWSFGCPSCSRQAWYRKDSTTWCWARYSEAKLINLTVGTYAERWDVW